MADPVTLNLIRFAPRYAALLKDAMRARQQAVVDSEYLRWQVLTGEVAMIGDVIAHQSQLRDARAQ